MEMDIKSVMLGVFLFLGVVFMIFAMVPTFKASGDSTATGYNTTNIPDLNALLNSPPYEDNATAQVINCSQNATRTFNISGNIGSTVYLTSWVTCPPIVDYTGNITVTYYFNGSELGTTNMTNCETDTTNAVVVEIDAVIPDGLYNVTWETNLCPATTPEGNLMVFGNATCTEPLDSNGQCMTYSNDTYTYTVSGGGFTTAENSILAIIILFLVMVAVIYGLHLF
jgi:hypothetical protein